MTRTTALANMMNVTTTTRARFSTRFLFLTQTGTQASSPHLLSLRPSISRLATNWFSSSPSSSTTTSASASTPTYRVAIVGSGPSGCYTAKYLLSATAAANSGSGSTTDLRLSIDMFERLPTTYGLVRNGVAPDHPEVKNVQNDFDQLFLGISGHEHHTEKNKIINLYANVTIGTDLTLQELRQHYDVVVLASGCEGDRQLPGITDVGLEGVLSARQFVNWYNGHPEYDWVGSTIKEVMNQTEARNDINMGTFNVVVIGHGNVALDCARVLAKTVNPDSMASTDIASRALDVLSNGNDCRRIITVVGRRGYVQAAFTIKEARELTKLEEAAFVLDSDDLEMSRSSKASQRELADSRPKQRIDKLLTEHLQKQQGVNSEPAEADGSRSEVRLRFLMNPIRVEPQPDNPNLLGRVICERTKLVGDEPGKQTAQGTGEEIAIDADLCLVSIGYRGVPIPGTEPYFDSGKGIIRNDHGRVVPLVGMNNDDDDANSNLAPLYVSGWLKRGPSGIIGTNIPDAKDTVASILHDLLTRKEGSSKDVRKHHDEITQLLKDRNVQIVDWESYQRIDQHEQSAELKRHPDQPREKMTSISDLLKVAASR